MDREHRGHIMTQTLREPYDYLVDMGEADTSFDVSENVPKGQNRKKAVNYRYAGRRANPFAFIVNSGERKDYHLFYIRHPKNGNLDCVKESFPNDKIKVNPRDEITVHIHDLIDAKKMWAVVKDIQLQ